MGRALWPVLVAIAIVVLIPPDIPSQPPTIPRRNSSSEEIQQLKKQYVKLRTELKSRRMLKSILEINPHADLRYLASQYGLLKQPELTHLSDTQIRGQLVDLESEFRTVCMMYGENDFKEIYLEIPESTTSDVPFISDDRILKASMSVVAIICRDSMVNMGDTWNLKTAQLNQVMGNRELCDFDLNNFNAPCTDVRGTGFLVHDQIIATAGHLVQSNIGDPANYSNWLESVYFVFDYKMQSEGVVKTTFSKDEVYEGNKVLADYYDARGGDWALIQLSRPVEGRDPLSCRKYGKISREDKVFTLGHPNGMPMKYSGPAKILDNDPCNDFYCDIDVHQFNSGSPVFNESEDMGMGILVEGIVTQDVESFTEFCACFAPAVYNSQMGRPGVAVTRSILFKRFLAWPDHIFIECTVPEAIIKTMASDGSEFSSPLSAGSPPAQLPYSDEGVFLLVYADSCWVRYFPLPSELWRIEPSLVYPINVMVKVCE